MKKRCIEWHPELVKGLVKVSFCVTSVMFLTEIGVKVAYSTLMHQNLTVNAQILGAGRVFLI